MFSHSTLKTAGVSTGVATPFSLQGIPEVGGFLGIHAKSLTPPLFGSLKSARARLEYPQNEVAGRLEKWALQSVARSILPRSRTGGCLRNRVEGSQEVGVKWSGQRKRASYAGLQTCGSVWACPICASKVSEHRRGELVALVAAHKAAGGTVLLVTRTFPHSARQPLAGMLAKLAQAENKFKQGKPWERLKARFGVVGSVRAVEATFGANGWHPHIHELVFLAGPVDEAAFAAALFARWVSAATRAGFAAPSVEHGLDVRDGSQAAAYASKWGMEAELTKWQLKRGKEGSLGPFDLLRVALTDDDAQAVATARLLFAEYAQGFRGKRQLVYSPGLRKLYNLAPELTDDEAAEGSEPDAVVLGRLTLAQWRAVLRANKRGQLLEAINAAGGDWSAIDEVLGEALAVPVLGPEPSDTNRTAGRKRGCRS